MRAANWNGCFVGRLTSRRRNGASFGWTRGAKVKVYVTLPRLTASHISGSGDMAVDRVETGTGPIWSRANDTRVTSVGRFMRKTRLDEIPQLWNVLSGEMSLIGPRPERPSFVEQLTQQIPFYGQRHVVKPGLTGWAQVRYSYGASVEDAVEKMQYDLFYVKNLSMRFDLVIAFETVKTVLLRRGAR